MVRDTALGAGPSSKQSSGQGRPFLCRPQEPAPEERGSRRSGLAWKISWISRVYQRHAVWWVCESLECWCSPRHQTPSWEHLLIPCTVPMLGRECSHFSPLSHPRSNVPLKTFLSSCQPKKGLRCSESSISSQATDLPACREYLHLTPLQQPLLCAPNLVILSEGRSREKFPVSPGSRPHKLYAQRTRVLVVGARHWPDVLPISQLATGDRC